MSVLAEDVAFLLAEHGYDLTLTRQVPGAYNPATGLMGAATTATHTIRGVFIAYEQEHINNTTILADDRKLLIQAKGIPVVPKMGDTIGDVQIVSPLRKFQSGDTVIAYTAQTRG